MHNFKVGDKVCIVRETRDWSDTWRNGWTRSMKDQINNNVIYTIRTISTITGISFVEDTSFRWDPLSLELVKHYSTEEKVLNKCKKLWNNSNFVRANPHLKRV